MEDEKIVELYWQRDENAIRQTEKKYGGYCRTVAWNILADEQDTEECVSDTWMGAWSSMPANRPKLLAPYLAKLTRWLALSRLRERKSLKRGGGELALALDELEEAVDTGTDLQRELEIKELNAALLRFLKGMDKTQARVFLARYWYFASIAEIAERYGFTESKVTSMLHRTRMALGRYLKEEGLC